MKTKEQAAQEYADNISKDYPFNTSKEAQASLIKNDFLAGYNAAISVCEQEMDELRRKQLLLEIFLSERKFALTEEKNYLLSAIADI